MTTKPAARSAANSVNPEGSSAAALDAQDPTAMQCENPTCGNDATVSVRTNDPTHGTGFACTDHASDMIEGLLDAESGYSTMQLEALMPDVAAIIDGPLSAAAAATASTRAGQGPSDGSAAAAGGLGRSAGSRGARAQ